MPPARPSLNFNGTLRLVIAQKVHLKTKLNVFHDMSLFIDGQTNVGNIDRRKHLLAQAPIGCHAELSLTWCAHASLLESMREQLVDKFGSLMDVRCQLVASDSVCSYHEAITVPRSCSRQNFIKEQGWKELVGRIERLWGLGLSSLCCWRHWC